jgi:hypothetical protein
LFVYFVVKPTSDVTLWLALTNVGENPIQLMNDEKE